MSIIWATITQAEEVPLLPKSATFFAKGTCTDSVTKQSLRCLIYRDGADTYMVLLDQSNKPVRITWAEGLKQPISVWVRHGHDTY